MAHLLNVWPSICQRLLRTDRVLLLFDYDGTLTPIVARPEDALLSDDVRGLLRTLAARPTCIVGIVSGRSLADLAVLADIPGMVHAGNHGMEIRGHGMDFTHPGALAAHPVLDEAEARLSLALDAIPGTIVEHKGLTLTVHYRSVAEHRVSEVETAVASSTAGPVEAGSLRLTQGKKVIEVRPAISWDKGKAIERIWTGCGDRPLPFYFGDDRTDEDGFRAVQALGGIAVFVGPARQGTVALHQLESPQEVAETLRLLVEQV